MQTNKDSNSNLRAYVFGIWWFYGQGKECQNLDVFKCQFYSCVQKSVLQLDWGKKYFVFDHKPRRVEM